MFAIIKIGSNQYKIFEDKFLYVPFIKKSKGDILDFHPMCILNKQGKIFIGNPILKNYNIKIMILDHILGKKIIIFKKKRRKGYKVKKGYRQKLTKIKILAFTF